VCVYVVNRDVNGEREVEITDGPAGPGPDVVVHAITGDDASAANTWEHRTAVAMTTETRSRGRGSSFGATLPPLSITAFVFDL
jgi:alpha-L-arabinofuranosidase